MKDLTRFKNAVSQGNSIYCSVSNIGSLSEYRGQRGATYWFSFCYAGSTNIDIYGSNFKLLAKNADLLY